MLAFLGLYTGLVCEVILPFAWFLIPDLHAKVSILYILTSPIFALFIMPLAGLPYFTVLWLWYRRYSWQFSDQGIVRIREGVVQDVFTWNEINFVSLSRYGANITFDVNQLRKATIYITFIHAKQLVNFIPKAKTRMTDRFTL